MTALMTKDTLTPIAPFRDEEPLFEIIDGQKVELPPMSAYACRIASRLGTEVNSFSKISQLGEAVVEVLFRLPLPVERNRRPDMAFVSYQRWPKSQPQPFAENAWNVVPNLAAEVVSPNEKADDLMGKIAEYFQAGVEAVWVVYPGQQVVHVFQSWTAMQILTRADVLEGGGVLPGFRLPLTELFPEVLPPNGAPLSEHDE